MCFYLLLINQISNSKLDKKATLACYFSTIKSFNNTLSINHWLILLIIHRLSVDNVLNITKKLNKII